eukprot:scaffold5472_cov391-Prasinococcus_capsulatus_cf.AAC.2
MPRKSSKLAHSQQQRLLAKKRQRQRQRELSTTALVLPVLILVLSFAYLFATSRARFLRPTLDRIQVLNTTQLVADTSVASNATATPPAGPQIDYHTINVAIVLVEKTNMNSPSNDVAAVLDEPLACFLLRVEG